MNFGSMKFTIDSETLDLVCTYEKSYETKSWIFIFHGYVMWITWGGFCLIQLIFVRWCRHWWKYGYIVHSTAGIITCLATLLMGYPDFVFHWRGAFSLIGLIFVPACGVIMLMGMYMLFIIAFRKWEIKSLLRWKAAHYYLGFSLIFLGQVLTFIGMEGFRNFYPGDYLYLFYIHIGVFVIIYVAFEAYYQIFKRRETPFKRSGLPLMSCKEFH